MDRRVFPEVVIRGPGDPVAAIVGGIHGDEPSGVRAVRRLLHEEHSGVLTCKRAVKLIIANPPAVEAGKRFLDVDMNRSFPGDPQGNREQSLASAVCEAVADLPTLALHATQSHFEPFAFIEPDDERSLDLVRKLPVQYLILARGEEYGAFGVCGSVITMEAGRQGTETAADLAYSISKAFLCATGVLDGAVRDRSQVVFELHEEIDKPAGTEYEVLVSNFSKVDAGQAFATVDGRDIIAEETFYPVLMSPYGYDEIFGFKGQKIADTLPEATSRDLNSPR